MCAMLLADFTHCVRVIKDGVSEGFSGLWRGVQTAGPLGVAARRRLSQMVTPSSLVWFIIKGALLKQQIQTVTLIADN
jgi:hypothetical protein